MKFLAKTRYLIPALAAGTALALLAGCPSQSTQKQSAAPPPVAQSASFHGVAFGGRQPITGATVVAYEIGSPQTEIGSDVTDSNGRFTITFSPTPATGQLVFVTASGGNGGGGIGSNPAIGLMTVAGGYCTTGTPGCAFPGNVNINELTTIATTAVLKHGMSFAACSTIANNSQSGQCPVIDDSTGLEYMAPTLGNLVNVATGQASDFLAGASQTAGGALRATREKLDTLASVLAACVNAAGPGDTACTGLFGALLDNPTDTLHAAWEIASIPAIAARPRALYGLTPDTPVFAPALTTVPAGIVGDFWTVGGERYAFSANSGTGTVSAWRMGGDLDTMDGSPFTAGNDPDGIAMDPNGHYVYVANKGGTISGYTIGDDGTLNPIAGSPFTIGSTPAAVAVDPSGSHLYVTDDSVSGPYTDSVTRYIIGANGTLSVNGSITVPTGGSQPESVTVDPSGRYVYVGNRSDGSVSAFTIDAGGSFEALPGSPYDIGGITRSVTVDPSGQYLYVASGDIYIFAIGANGALSEIAASPVASGLEATWVAIDPNGQHLYAANHEGSVSAYTIGLGGSLAEIAGSPYAGGSLFLSVAVDPSDRFVYATDYDNDGVVIYAIGADGGLSEVVASTATGVDPWAVTVDPSGRFIYVANNGDQTVSAYTIGTAGGFIPVAASPFAAGAGTYSVAVDPVGRYVFAANHDDNNVSAFLVGDDGKLAEVAGSPFATGAYSVAVAEDAGGHHVYVANYNDGTVSAYAIGAGGVLGEIAGSPYATGANPVSIALSPDGSSLYVANYSGSVSAFAVGAGGALSEVAGSPYAAGSAPYSVAVNSSGQYVYVANSGSDNVSAWAIGAGGALMPIAGSPFAAGGQPRSVAAGAFDTLYVSNYDDDTVSYYQIGAGGVLTAISTVVTGDGPQGIATDPLGFYFYVTNSVSNDLSAYANTILFGTFELGGSPFPAGGTVPVSIAIQP